MSDLFAIYDANTGKIKSRESLPEISINWNDKEATQRINDEISDFEEITFSSSAISIENLLNQRRLRALKLEFTGEIIRLFEEEDFEYGIETKADIIVRDQMMINSAVTKEWLNDIFVRYFGNTKILIGLLRVIARIDYVAIAPQGSTMAIAALNHQDPEIQECGIRAFESWGTLENLNMLTKIQVSTLWLQEYLEQVVLDLQKEFHVLVNSENQ